MNLLLNIGLILHICGISLMVGMTMAGFVTYRRLFISMVDNNDIEPVITIAKLFSGLQISGGVLIILGGILMMIAFHGLIMGQLWFKLKISLLLLLILNVPLTYRPASIKLHGFLNSAQPDQRDITKARQLLNRFYITQLLIFLGIFILSVFRFN